MRLFPRKSKQTPGAFYFGEFDDKPLAPFSISLAEFGADFSGEPVHYHAKNQKVFVTLEGEGVLEVNGQEVPMTPENMIHIEPGERHRIVRVTKAPLKFIVVLSAKENDKVVE